MQTSSACCPSSWQLPSDGRPRLYRRRFFGDGNRSTRPVASPSEGSPTGTPTFYAPQQGHPHFVLDGSPTGTASLFIRDTHIFCLTILFPAAMLWGFVNLPAEIRPCLDWLEKKPSPPQNARSSTSPSSASAKPFSAEQTPPPDAASNIAESGFASDSSSSLPPSASTA